MTGSADNKSGDIETVTRFVYGQTFARYDRAAFEEFLRPLKIRLENNGIPADVFRGKSCLDAGCGGGRGTILMLQAGAQEVTAFDLAEQNCNTTRGRAAEYGFHNVTVRNGSLLDLPFEDEAFDIVWCNGVLHHTADPGRALAEVARVLKRGGWMWLYLYGSGGVYWYFVDFVREWLADVPPQETLAVLTVAGIPVGNIAEFIDDWHVPVLKRYRHGDLIPALEKLGFTVSLPLTGGVPYDTSVSRADEGTSAVLGEGDLRYWIRKDREAVKVPGVTLPDVAGKGSDYHEHPEVLALGRLFTSLDEAVTGLAANLNCSSTPLRVLTAARLQIILRGLLPTRPFDLNRFRSALNDSIATIRSLPSSV